METGVVKADNLVAQSSIIDNPPDRRSDTASLSYESQPSFTAYYIGF